MPVWTVDDAASLDFDHVTTPVSSWPCYRPDRIERSLPTALWKELFRA
jgi:hypothetical protein